MIVQPSKRDGMVAVGHHLTSEVQGGERSGYLLQKGQREVGAQPANLDV